jgi:hypothetical protein
MSGQSAQSTKAHQLVAKCFTPLEVVEYKVPLIVGVHKFPTFFVLFSAKSLGNVTRASGLLSAETLSMIPSEL